MWLPPYHHTLARAAAAALAVLLSLFYCVVWVVGCFHIRLYSCLWVGSTLGTNCIVCLLLMVGKRAQHIKTRLSCQEVDSSSFRLYLILFGSHVVRGSFPDHNPLLHPSPLELLLPSPPVSHLSCTRVNGALCSARRRWGHNFPALHNIFRARTHSCRSADEGEGA